MGEWWIGKRVCGAICCRPVSKVASDRSVSEEKALSSEQLTPSLIDSWHRWQFDFHYQRIEARRKPHLLLSLRTAIKVVWGIKTLSTQSLSLSQSWRIVNQRFKGVMEFHCVIRSHDWPTHRSNFDREIQCVERERKSNLFPFIFAQNLWERTNDYTQYYLYGTSWIFN